MQIYLDTFNSKKLNIYDGYHDYVYIDDLILFIKKLITENRIKNYGEIVNFGGKQFSNLRLPIFVKKFSKKIGNIYAEI